MADRYSQGRPDPLTQDELEALRTGVPRCRVADLGTPGDTATPEGMAIVENYLSHFAAPIKQDGMPCLRCDKPLVGMLAFMHGGGFEWGIAHGEGHCANCRWPARAYHFIKDNEGSELLTIRNLVLQVHPADIEIVVQAPC